MSLGCFVGVGGGGVWSCVTYFMTALYSSLLEDRLMAKLTNALSLKTGILIEKPS